MAVFKTFQSEVTYMCRIMYEIQTIHTVNILVIWQLNIWKCPKETNEWYG